MSKEKKEFKWWWQDPKEMALWEKLNSMPKEKIDERVKRRLTEKYGNIYWYSAFPAFQPFHRSEAISRLIHGNNSSGKSYACAAETAYEIVGWSPYRDVKDAKYGDKIIWCFSPSFDVQRSSSQVHLFSTDSANDIGLLPSFKTITEYGGHVSWGKSKCLDFVKFPDGKTLEFKSLEMQTFNLQAAGIDFCWFDEEPKLEERKDEIEARLLRKNGKMVMSFILPRPFGHWIVDNLWQPLQDGELTEDMVQFFFVAIDDNLSLTEAEREMAKKRVGTRGGNWRFSEGGEFALQPFGDLVYPDFNFDWHVKEGLLASYDPLRLLFRSWDIGYRHPAVVGFQLDKWGRRRYLFAILGRNKETVDFIKEVEAFTAEHMPKLHGKFEILPHDANAHHSSSSLSDSDIFDRQGLKHYDVIYTHRKGENNSFTFANDSLRQSADKEPVVMVDKDFAAILHQCLGAYVVDEKTGEPQMDNYYEHISDCFKKAEYWYYKKGGNNTVVPRDPRYLKISLGGSNENWQ